MMTPELSRRLARAIQVIPFESLQDRYAFVDRIETATTFDDLSEADQLLVTDAEAAHPPDAPLTHPEPA